MNRSTLMLAAAAAAAAFDLGVLVVAGHADTLQPSNEAKTGGPAASLQFCANGQHFGKTCKADAQNLHIYKFDNVNTPQACMNNGGTPVTTSAGQQACQSKRAISGWVEILSFPSG